MHTLLPLPIADLQRVRGMLATRGWVESLYCGITGLPPSPPLNYVGPFPFPLRVAVVMGRA